MKKSDQKNSYFPIMLNISNKKCLVIGGGKVGERKVLKLLEFEAEVTLISQSFTKKLKELAESGEINLIDRSYSKSDIKDFYLVFIATNDKEINQEIAEECQDKKILYCIVDGNWKNSAFITPASFKKENITITVSTNGEFCSVSKKIKDGIKKVIPSE